jgi:pentatricopeptide repeat protein
MEQFLEANRDVFSKESWQRQYDYLRALAWFYTGEITAAEARIRLLRDELDPGADLYGRAGWLLGKILQEQHQPEPALSVFEDVLEHGVPGPYHTAAMLGRAESLGEMQRYDKSVAAYNETIKLTTEDPYNAPIDLKDIRVSTTEWYQRLHDDGQLADAMSYLRIAARLAPPIETQLQMTYAGLLADLAFELGQQEMTAVDEAVDDGIRAQTELDRARRDGRDVARDEAEARDSATQSEVEAAHASETEHGQRARSYFVEAGETYLRLARLAELEPDEATRAMWRAADSFDRAGVRDRTAEVLEEFVAEFPGNPRIPEALLRLGQVYQAGQQHDKAIEHYQANLVNFPRTRSAIASLVPLADCFIATGLLDKAETTLLRIIDHAPGDPLEPVEPVALIYKEALYRLAELYGEANEHERAIARYEEAIERYPDDPRADEAVFLLADAYRKNAAQLKRAIEDKRNIAFRDDLRLKYRRRLQRAYELFEEAIERYRDKSEAEMSDLEKLYVKLSHFYRGDAVYDLAFLTQIEDTQYFARAVEMYDRAAWLYQTDPMALSAYTQMINCYLRMGQTEEARKTLNRAMWALRNISDEQFSRYSPLEGREFWRNYLDWLARTPTFRVAEYEHQQAETEAEDQTSPVG